MSEIRNFIEISKYAGERFDLVQAGGGNSSVKLDCGMMVIKASGFMLSDVDVKSGYSKVDNKKIASIVHGAGILDESDKRKREARTESLVKSATVDDEYRPSIETLLHSLLRKYTLHTHPLVVNMIVIRKEWKNILGSIFSDEHIACVDYKTPGIELALELNKCLETHETIPKIIFLQNHGLIVTAENKDDIYELTEKVLRRIETYLNIDMTRYKLTNKVTSLLKLVEKQSNNISYLSEDKYLLEKLAGNRNLFFESPFCPDSLVFCGIKTLDLSGLTSLKKYKGRFLELPKVIIFGDRLFFSAVNVKKAKEIEEVMKFNIMVLEQNINIEKNFLDIEELSYLSNWEAEKFRQGL